MATITVSSDSNYSSIGHADNDTIVVTEGATLVIDTDTNRIEDLRCITFGTFLIQNTSATTPIFIDLGDDTANAFVRMEGGGVLRARGAWITLGTSDGTAGQTFTLPTNAAGELFGTLAGLEVVDSGDVTLFNRVDSLTDTFGDDKFGAVFTHDVATGTITFGDGFNGAIPPAGTTIRIPNIHFKESSTGTVYTDFDLNIAGAIDLETCSWSDNFAFNFSSASSVRLHNCFFAEGRENFSLTNTDGADLRNVVITANLQGGASLSSCNNSTIEGFRYYNVHAGSNSQWIYSSGSGGSLRNAVLMNPNMPRATNRGMVAFTSSNIDLENVYCAAASVGFYFTSGSGSHVLNRCFSNAAGKRNPAHTAAYSISIANSANSIIENCGFWPETEADGLVATDAQFYNLTTGSSNCTIANSRAYLGEVGGAVNAVNLVFCNGSGHRMGNIDVTGYSTGDIVNHSASSSGLSITNIRLLTVEASAGDFEWASGARAELAYTQDDIDTLSSNAGIDVASFLLYESNDLLSGRLYRVMAPDVTLGLFNVITQTGVITFDNTGRLLMANSGDVVEIETLVHRGIESFTGNVSLSGTSTGNFSIEIAMRTPNGTYTSFLPLSTANIISTFDSLSGYSPDDGLQVKYRVTRAASNLTDSLRHIRLDVNIVDGFSAPFEARPTDLNISGLSVGDSIYIEDAAHTQKAFEIADGSTYSMPLPNANDGEVWTYVVKRAGFNHQRGTFTISAGVDVAVAASLTQKQQATGGAMFTGSNVSSIGVDFDLATPQMSIDISQPQTSPQNVFDKVELCLVTNDGMRWLAAQNADTAFQNLGGAGSFLFHQANIRLRRRVASDANAEVLAFVFSTDGIAVDETNGTVAVFSGTLVRDVWEGIVDDYDDVNGSFGQAITVMLSRLDANISSRLAQTEYAQPDNANIVAIKERTDNLPNNPATEETASEAKVNAANAFAVSV